VKLRGCRPAKGHAPAWRGLRHAKRHAERHTRHKAAEKRHADVTNGCKSVIWTSQRWLKASRAEAIQPAAQPTDPDASEALYALLGDLPERQRPIGVDVVACETREWYELEVLLLDLNSIEPVPAYFKRPRETGEPYPTGVYNRAHGGDYGLGKDGARRTGRGQR